jgi:type I restriction enzyme, S subunit
MIADLEAYPEYKTAGLPWLDAIPDHWEMVPNRALMQDQRQTVGENAADYTLLSLTLRGIVARNMDNPKGKFPAQFNSYKIVRPDDLVFCLFDIDETPRGVGHSKLNGMITGAYDVFSPRPRSHPRFLYLYYLFVDEGKLLKPLYTGLRKTIQRGVFASLKAPFPPPDEQSAIVRFLDYANGRLERAIRAKRKILALLHEQKQAIIHRAVTRGLDPTVPLKPSGIPWLGDIPEPWETRRNSWLFDERIEKGRAGLPILVVSLRTGVTEGSDTDEDGRPKRLIADVTGYKFAESGDIAYNMMRMWQGAVGVVPTDGLVSPAYVVAKPRFGVFSAYYELLFRTDGCRNEINRNSRGIVSDRNRLYWDQFKRLCLPLPSLDEQKRIVAQVEAETRTLNRAIARLEREISLLREYRTRLVVDVVTGKLDVREAACQLPDEATESGADILAEDLSEEAEAGDPE